MLYTAYLLHLTTNVDNRLASRGATTLPGSELRAKWISQSLKIWGIASSNVRDDNLNDPRLDTRSWSRPTLGRLPSL